MERILEQLEKKNCKFKGCNFKRNSQALVTEHEETCAHKTFKCKWSEQGCNFEATKALKLSEKSHELRSTIELGRLDFYAVGKSTRQIQSA